jgi:hypothetical protein
MVEHAAHARARKEAAGREPAARTDVGQEIDDHRVAGCEPLAQGQREARRPLDADGWLELQACLSTLRG